MGLLLFERELLLSGTTATSSLALLMMLLLLLPSLLLLLLLLLFMADAGVRLEFIDAPRLPLVEGECCAEEPPD